MGMNESDLPVTQSESGTVHVVSTTRHQLHAVDDDAALCGAGVDEAVEPLDIDDRSPSLCGNCANQLEQNGLDPDRLRNELR